MRINNLKIHLFAISAICAVIIAIFFAMGGDKAPKGPQPLQGDRYIQIDSSTWGRNCDPYVDEALQKWKPTTPPTPRPRRAANDNALVAVSNACNGQLKCTFKPTSEWVGDEPLASCSKYLEIRYRCFAYDPLIFMDAGEHDTVVIDCAKKPANPSKTNASAVTPH
jgi:hypothetical protein